MTEQKLIEYLSKFSSRSFLDIAKHFRISPTNNKSLTSLLSVLQKEYKVFKNNKDEYYAPVLKEVVTGDLNVSAKGSFGFVDYNIDEVNNTKESIFIKNFNFNTALHNDTVKVNIYTNPVLKDEAKNEGVVVEIVSRNTVQIEGFIKQKNQHTYFVPADQRMQGFTWTILSSLVNTKLNDLVVAKIIKYEQKNILIQVERVITNEADPMVYVKYYLEHIKAPLVFPSELKKEISNIPKDIQNENISSRKDLRNRLIVTIDGNDTKDFDDAIYVEKLPNGNFLLGVYIADVSHYVKEDTEIDKEALKRGTSIYLVDRVIPMLPEELSNGICSLNPNEDRFVLACEIEIDKYGNTVNKQVFEAIIESKYRLTYQQVDHFYKTNNLGNAEKTSLSFELKNMLNVAKELSLIIHNFKINEGYVDFEIVEPKIKLNDDGSVKEIQINKRGFSEMLIEDFMVRTNETIARFLFDNKIPTLYRVHDVPDDLKLTNLKNTLDVINVKTKKLNPNHLSPKEFANFVDGIKEARNDDFIKLMFLRTMQKAVYSEHNIGHFGLASEFYCHFTSPIRRYPDLVVHRAIRDFIIKKKYDKLSDFTQKISVYSDLNTKSEQKAVQMERNVNDLKFAEYLKNQIGKTFRVQILSVLAFGFFVEFDFKASGLIHKTNIFDGNYDLNETATKLIGEKRSFSLGDYVEVVVVGVDLVEGKIDCVLLDQYETYLNKKQSPKIHKNTNFKKEKRKNDKPKRIKR
ncbi:ribonuclease R [Mycoplasma leonicaptivi]|uniref:ribonuclease R n=1 Tax=Mycoplasma leonicaptivi TaxID=36742 RepID=UPI0004875664|nr:ribonuclease R [Mycoplasma leonicaptivi]